MPTMILRALVAAFALVTLASPGAAAVRALKFAQGPVVLLAPDSLAGSVEVGLWYAAGTRNDPPGQSGLAFAVGRSLVRPAPAAQRSLVMAGGSYNEILTPDLTAGSLTLPAELVRDGIAAFIARLRAPSVSPTGLRAALSLAKSDRDARLAASPLLPGIEDVFQSGYAGHGYAAPVMGRAGDAARITAAAARADLAARFAPGRALITVVGRFDPADALARLRASYGEPATYTPRAAAGTRAAFRPSTGAPRSIPLAVGVPVLLMGWRGPAVTDPDFPAFDLLAHLLTGGSSPFAPATLAQPAGPFAQVLGGVDRRTDASMLFLIAVAGDDTAATMQRLTHGVERLGRDGVPEDEVARARASLEAAMEKSTETPQGRATALASSLLLEGRWDASEQRTDRVRALTPEALQRVASRYLDASHRTVVISVPQGAAPGGQ